LRTGALSLFAVRAFAQGSASLHSRVLYVTLKIAAAAGLRKFAAVGSRSLKRFELPGTAGPGALALTHPVECAGLLGSDLGSALTREKGQIAVGVMLGAPVPGHGVRADDIMLLDGGDRPLAPVWIGAGPFPG
jgi:hypothetical protein